jgi:hypothetical protein
MADSLIQVDDDWKKKAQEEKRALAEKAKARQAPPPAAAPTESAPAAPVDDDAMPAASIETLCQNILTQTMLYLGLVGSGGRRMVDMDAARQQVDLLAVLKDKTAGNLTQGETDAINIALHDARSRFTAVASQMII